MKAIILLAALLMAGCSTPTEVVQHIKDEVEVRGPKDSHLVWCHGQPSDCYDSAANFCGAWEERFSSIDVRPKPGKWHAVAESGMAFPAMIQETGGWRMLIACD
jgi:hypothetical protein